MPLKIASWNINSVRARLHIIERFLDEERPDILCLQETKVTDDLFPGASFAARGYVHQVVCGQRLQLAGSARTRPQRLSGGAPTRRERLISFIRATARRR